MTGLFDTHCHVHEIDAEDGLAEKWHKNNITDAAAVVRGAHEAGVSRLMVVGCTLADSEHAVEFADRQTDMWASIGIHPHEAAETLAHPEWLERFTALAADSRVTAIGECGLDYFYNHSPKPQQLEILRFQLELAQRHAKPMIFHVRDAFDDFWPEFDAVPGLQGVIHSFTADQAVLEQILARGLYVGLNGIMTFTNEPAQLAAAKAVPLDRLVLETDSPFLTPKPFRGKVNVPAYIAETASFLADLRGEPLDELAAAAMANACRLFQV